MAERELVQGGAQVGVRHGALVRPEEPALGHGGHAVHPGPQLARIVPAGAGGPLVASVVDVAQHR